MFKKISIFMFAILYLAGCSGKSALEKYVEDAEAAAKEQYSSLLGDFDLKMSVKDQSIYYTYTYNEQLTQEQAKTQATSIPQSLTAFESTYVDILNEAREIDASTKAVVLEYYNNDNSHIVTVTFDGNDVYTETDLISGIDDYVASLNSQFGEFANEGFGMKILVSGNSIVYRYQFDEETSYAITDDVKTQLQEQIAAQESVMLPALQEAQVYDSNIQSLIVEYVNHLGEVLVTQEFK